MLSRLAILKKCRGALNRQREVRQKVASMSTGTQKAIQNTNLASNEGIA